jgi:cellulose synthase/poly-beta-1,6-N-acetylglucosamine synthase-like glycosyltransferase
VLDAELPTYSIMVPLFDEAEVLPRLVSSLAALDYPTAKLEVLLILESADGTTREALSQIRLPAHFRSVIVPPHGPRTKPKALNYALGLVRGDFVVVYDAEDRPEPGQLRAALETFGRHDENLVCVQARLNVYNERASFLSRQFALEYSALFDAILPALERLSLPIPLGGTSNHFRTQALRDLGAWDAFNVTEDADLGIRLARQGLRTATVASTTWEEAPTTFGNWLRQRTRWLKGWMQTYIVHMRYPRRLARQLGPLTFVGFQAFMGGILLSMLVHPIFYIVVGLQIWQGHLFMPMETAIGIWFWWIASINLALGYSTSILVGALSVVRRGRWRLALSSLAMPFYWLLISVAGYRAIIQLARRPYIWEKTKHGVGSAERRQGMRPAADAGA